MQTKNGIQKQPQNNGRDFNLLADTLIELGFSPIPVDPATKQPIVTTWKPSQTEVVRYENYKNGIAIVTGFNGLCVIDIDNHFKDADQLFSKLKGLIDISKYPTVRTQSGGYHLYLRCSEVGKNQNLAQRVNGKGRPETLIETREAGGYAVCPNTPGYNFLQGDFETIPLITPKERNDLIQAAKSLNEYVRENNHFTTTVGDERPGDIYNADPSAVGEVQETLKSAGWKTKNNINWTRPDKDKGNSATFGKVAPGWFYVFSSNAHPFESDKAYNPFQVKALLEYGGDFHACSKDLAQRYKGELKSTIISKNGTKNDAYNYIRVGNVYYKEISLPNMHGEMTITYIIISRQTLIDDFGKYILKEIPKYNSWCNVPDNIKHKPVINNCRNLYQPLRHEPKPGTFETTISFLQHIFGDQYKLGLDYIQLLLTKPTPLDLYLCLLI
jgi:hypothetical protein